MDLPIFELTVNGDLCRLSDEMLGVIDRAELSVRPKTIRFVGQMAGRQAVDLPGCHSLSDALSIIGDSASGWSARDINPLLRGVADGFLLEPEELG